MAIAFAFALLGAAPVAAKAAFFFQQNGSFVSTSSDPACTGAGPYVCDAYFLNVFVGRDHVVNAANPAFPDGVYPGDRVCYEHDHWASASANPPADSDAITSYDFNCNRTVGQATFDQQKSATLRPTTIEVLHFDCTGANPYPDCNQASGTTPQTFSGVWMARDPSRATTTGS